jgi:uncharacterized protein DUF6968
MEFESIGEIIASRMLHVMDEQGNKRPVSVFIGKPQPAADSSGYHCAYQIIGIGNQETQIGHGRDSIQALKTAMVLLGTTLDNLNHEIGGKLVWNGAAKGELGLP